MFFVKKLAFSFIVLFSGVMVADAQQSSRLDEILNRGVLKIGTPGDYKPFTYKDPVSGQFTGFDIDQAQSLSKALGVKLEIVETSWPSLTTDFRAGKFDIAMGGVSATLERQKYGLFSVSYMDAGKAPLTRCADRDKFNTLAAIDKPEVKVIVNPGGTNAVFVKDNIRQAQIVRWKDNLGIFIALAAGKGDVMITDSVEALYQQKLHPKVLCAATVEQPFNKTQKAYWIQRDPYLAAFVDQWLRQEQLNGSLESLRKKWLY